jgi:hypothetical protein
MAENMNATTSPRLKSWRWVLPVNDFAGGLVRRIWSIFMVSAVDTFIEKPCCVAFYRRSHLQRGRQMVRAVVKQKQAVRQEISVSVGLVA